MILGMDGEGPEGMMRKLLLPLMALLICGGCVSKQMQKFQGQHYSTAITRLGPPTSRYSDGQGGSVIVWVLERRYVAPGRSTTRSTTSGTASGQIIHPSQVSGVYSQQTTSRTVYTPAVVQGWDAYRVLWVNASGVVYRWSWKGL